MILDLEGEVIFYYVFLKREVGVGVRWPSTATSTGVKGRKSVGVSQFIVVLGRPLHE